MEIVDQLCNLKTIRNCGGHAEKDKRSPWGSPVVSDNGHSDVSHRAAVFTMRWPFKTARVSIGTVTSEQ